MRMRAAGGVSGVEDSNGVDVLGRQRLRLHGWKGVRLPLESRGGSRRGWDGEVGMGKVVGKGSGRVRTRQSLQVRVKTVAVVGRAFAGDPSKRPVDVEQ